MDTQTARKHILFVDDEPHLLAALQRSLRAQRGEWDMWFAGSGEEALRVMDETALDAVVSDMRMPGMNGAELLRLVASRQPLTIRMVLSGNSDDQAVLSLVGTAHRFLAKPCDVSTLKTVLRRAFGLQDLLTDERLQAVVSALDSLPSLPALYQELNRKLQSPNATLREIGRLIAEDPPMTAKLLQVVNSAFFGVGRRITNPEDAATLVGLKTLKGMVLTAGIFRQFETPDGTSDLLSPARLWHHSLAVGRIARDIAAAEGCDQATVDDALAAGLLHDIGLLVLAFRLPEAWKQVQALAASERVHHWEAEQRIIGAAHNALGAYLLGLWGLPEAVVEAVGFNHRPMDAPVLEFGALAAVHVADALVHEDSRIDEPYLEALGLEHRYAAWQKLSEALSRNVES